ncbi:hypothetical protein EVAR_67327_1 [Eumeta japonica]|uniref:Cyclin N-terminal domain-containing protein n=1 Tax=Eumeta variegata TaxID=151549 RepID=A0A4C1ZWR1_EUMVA|nr:hypothetical protein EVAR_67327_1 [Eumeta japonica]
MEVNKENDDSKKTLTKIPVPKDHLPQLPKHLVYDVDCQRFCNARKLRRPPLKTLNTLPRAGCVRTSPSLDKLDSRHVTLRHVHDSPLDWELKVFSDVLLAVNDDGRNAEGDAGNGRPVTPASSKYFELSRVRNIKKSLKRPHSRELLELSPTERDDFKKTEEVKRKLNYSDFVPKPTTPLWHLWKILTSIHQLEKADNIRTVEQIFLNDSREYSKKRMVRLCYVRLLTLDLAGALPCPQTMVDCCCFAVKLKYGQDLVREYISDIIQHLLSVERKTLGTARVSNVTRACVVNWLMKINPIRNPQTVQTACWYLDSLLAIEEVRLEDLQLLGAACYWVAQKQCVVACSARRLVKQSADAFTVAELKIAEQKILSKLNFPPQPVMVHDFATYLCWWCDPRYEELEVAATYLTMVALLADKWLASELPSVLAAAVVTTALKLLHKRELLTKLKTSPVFAKPEVRSNLDYTCTRVRRAARLVASPQCEYRAPYVLYSQPPYFVALKVAKAISGLRQESRPAHPVEAVMGRRSSVQI